MAVTAMTIPDSRVTKIAQSDTWTALARVASVVGTCILVPIGGWVAYSEWQNSIALSSHTANIADIKASVDSIDKRGADDHDWVTTLRADMATVKDQIIILFQSRRPAPDKSPP